MRTDPCPPQRRQRTLSTDARRRPLLPRQRVLAAQVRNASTGALLKFLKVASSCFCGIRESGNAVFFGTGSPQQGTGDGVYAFTPLAVAPTGSG
jgi:hypothetical protein